jgi:hypothetical protein
VLAADVDYRTATFVSDRAGQLEEYASEQIRLEAGIRRLREHALAHHTVAIDRNLPMPGLLILDGRSMRTRIRPRASASGTKHANRIPEAQPGRRSAQDNADSENDGQQAVQSVAVNARGPVDIISQAIKEYRSIDASTSEEKARTVLSQVTCAPQLSQNWPPGRA